jgi:hypothetical protein
MVVGFCCLWSVVFFFLILSVLISVVFGFYLLYRLMSPILF